MRFQEAAIDTPRLDLDLTGQVATVTIVNPARRNAMTNDMWAALPRLLDELRADAGVRVLVLTRAGGTFCAGADITEVDRLVAEGEQSLAVRAEQAVAAFPKPTLAAIEGDCVGGGCQLAAACDLRFAAEGARFGVTPARLGIVYPASTTARLVALIGPSATKHLLYSADLIGADRALRIGLIDELHPAADLAARVAAFAGRLAERSLLTQVAAKEFVEASVHGTVEPGWVADWHDLMRTSGEAAEGIAAFNERRTPAFPWSPH
ncbi:enoyl-CoA hydratase/isomerase family protein [Catellatospora sp. KI3]|uniref:enoyl-CoA hydratase/isomerase family protein n=1 Tax=Catellatospora sp. KI3 TaxID=3041620 RepID=UPI0024830EED|nr:enoyl-CoA hydratase/isomerase family protein [Catellatospora sp. KI3]MDI1464493.1 enoyl-CoA hydratase/isomerase family protein [Catellatospora sp. KI3]